MAHLGVDVTPLAVQAEAMRAEQASVMHLAVDAKLAGILAVSDPVKATTAEALATLRKAGIRVVMATGDGLTTDRAVGQRLGIDEVHCGIFRFCPAYWPLGLSTCTIGTASAKH
jgi:Cu+-exporting ATPase